MTDSNATIIASYRYDPFGNTISATGTRAGVNLYRFSSKEIHADSGMYYYLYRFYDPNLQRWINRDPLGDIQGLASAHTAILSQWRGFFEPGELLSSENLYEFAHNSPENNSDPLGLMAPPVPPRGAPKCFNPKQPCSKSACQKYAWKGYQACALACLGSGPFAAGCESTCLLAYIAADNLCEACTAP
jgi:RHS repeat-associated protein